MYIYVEGFWATNLGDDLFLKILCERYPEITFEVSMENRHTDPFKNVKNLRIISKPDYSNKFEEVISKLSVMFNQLFHRRGFYIHNRFFFKRTSRPDAYVEISGSIFMFKKDENIKRNFTYNRRKKIVEKDTRYFIIGSNFGPYYLKDQLEAYRTLFSQMDDICFRDNYSKELFSDLTNVRCEADVVLNLSVPKVSENGEYVLFSLINIESKSDPEMGEYRKKANDYFNKVQTIILEYLKKKEKIVLFSFCEEQGDTGIANKLRDSLPKEKRNLVSVVTHKNIEDSLKIIAGAKKIIATRFHAMILGWVYQKPTFVISYNDKIVHTIGTLFPDQKYVSYLELKSLSFETLEASFTTIASETLAKLKFSAAQQFQALDNFVEESRKNQNE